MCTVVKWPLNTFAFTPILRTESKYKLLNHVIGWAFPFLTFLVTVALWGPCDAPGEILDVYIDTVYRLEL